MKFPVTGTRVTRATQMLGIFRCHMVDMYQHKEQHEETGAKVGFESPESQEEMLTVE